MKRPTNYYCATDCRESYVTGRYFYGALWFCYVYTNRY